MRGLYKAPDGVADYFLQQRIHFIEKVENNLMITQGGIPSNGNSQVDLKSIIDYIKDFYDHVSFIVKYLLIQ